MKEWFIEQYNVIKSLISSNIDSIESLVDQSKWLSNIISKLSEVDIQQHKSTIDSLSEINDKIGESINSLIKSTEDLFDEYTNFVNNVING